MKKIYSNYEFECYELEGKPILKVFNNNARNEWKRLVEHIRFATDENRTKYIEKYIANIKAHEEAKAERKEARKITVNPAKVGDILVSSWGYDQTNIDYYQVTEVVSRTMVKIREIGYSKQDGTSWGSYVVAPAKNCFRGEAMKKKVKKNIYKGGGAYLITIASYADAWLWDGSDSIMTNYA